MNKLFDLHNDFLTEIKTDKQKLRFLHDKKTGKQTEITSAVWTSKMSSEQAIKTIEDSFAFVNEYNQRAEKSLYLAIEDMHFVTKNNLDKILNIKPIYCGLTWNNDNILAGGALEGGDFTALGIEVVRELENSKIQIDTAHLSEKSFMTFSKITERPLLCSHTGVASCKPHNRNLKDYQIKMIVESDGLLGISLVGDFLAEEKKARVGDVARHIDYIVSRFGDKNICLGTDFYGTKNLPKGIKSYKDLVLLEERLRLLGYSDQTIENIFYKNALEFFQKDIFNPLV